MKLAYAELYLALGYLFRRLGRKIESVDTVYGRDVKCARDFFLPAPSKQGRGVRAIAKKEHSESGV